MATELIKHEMIRNDSNDEKGSVMKFAQKIRGKFIPKKLGIP